jgi:hypothetical protein
MYQLSDPNPSLTPENERWATYQIYGQAVATNFPFAVPLSHATGDGHLRFEVVKSAPVIENWPQLVPDVSAISSDGGEDFFYYRRDTYDLLRFSDTADFYIWPDRIVCHACEPFDRDWIEIDFLGSVFSCWLERQGIVAMHAAAVAIDGIAAAFVAVSQGGKSSLAATLVQSGFPLVTDDILPVEYGDRQVCAYPSYPQMRLWPDRAKLLLGRYRHLPLVYPGCSKRRVPVGAGEFGQFCSDRLPLGCWYLPNRRDPAEWGTAIAVEALSPRDAAIELVRHSFAAPIVQAMQLQPQRLREIAQIAATVPMRRLSYPSGAEFLPAVRDAILEDFATVTGSQSR